MTETLERAFAEATKLPAQEQDALGRWILAEITSEDRWDRAFEATEHDLARLADDALAEYRRGETKPLHLDER